MACGFFSTFVGFDKSCSLTLSIIIVNYNVKFFLEQCLFAVQRATAQLDAEVIVVDNGSSDNSLCYLHPKFPQVVFIESGANLGFAKACNTGLGRATGDFILFLNPDTIVAEESL
jgi:GT2 family glycosyltransferase